MEVYSFGLFFKRRYRLFVYFGQAVSKYVFLCFLLVIKCECVFWENEKVWDDGNYKVNEFILNY